MRFFSGRKGLNRSSLATALGVTSVASLKTFMMKPALVPQGYAYASNLVSALVAHHVSYEVARRFDTRDNFITPASVIGSVLTAQAVIVGLSLGAAMLLAPSGQVTPYFSDLFVAAQNGTVCGMTSGYIAGRCDRMLPQP